MKYIDQLKKLRREKLARYADIIALDSYLDQCKALVEKYPDNYGSIIKSCYNLYEMDRTEIPPFKHLVDWIAERTPMLSGDEYGYSDRLYWIFNGLTDFPKCANPNCDNKVGVGMHIKLHRGYPDYCCNKCAQSDEKTLEKSRSTHLERYGDAHYRNAEQIKKTNLELYGVECTFQSKDIQQKAADTRNEHIQNDPLYWEKRDEKSKKTKLERHGNEKFVNTEQSARTRAEKLAADPHCYDESYATGVRTRIEKYGSNSNVEKMLETRARHKAEDPEFQDKINKKVKQTKLENHGDENYSNVEGIKKTKLERYGDENYNNYEQAEKTCLEKYGVDNFSKTDECKSFQKANNLEKYGVEYSWQREDVKAAIKKTLVRKYGIDRPPQFKYAYNGLSFDSSWELAFYIWLTDHKIDFKYQPISIKFEFNGKQFGYKPDFLVETSLIEIKGDHFFDTDGKMICPWDSSKNDWYEAKHQCMVKNNVKILMSADIKPYLEYVKNTYGEDYLNSFKRQKKRKGQKKRKDV